MIYFLQVTFGFIGGIFGGMGMGGGTLLIPLLVIFLNMKQNLCQGINLISFLVMGIFSLYIHNRNNLLELKVVWPLVLGGALFSILGAFIASYLNGKILRLLFGIFLCVLGIIQLIKILRKRAFKS